MIVALVVLIFQLLGLWRFVRHIRFAEKLFHAGVLVPGLIISQRKTGGRHPQNLFKVRFMISSGAIIEEEKACLERGVDFFDGDEAFLYYDANKPTNFLFLQEMNQVKNRRILCFVSVFLLIFSFLLLGEYFQ